LPRTADLVTAGVAIVVHAGLAFVLLGAKQPTAPRKPKPVVLQFERRVDPPPVPAAPPARPPSARRVSARPRPTSPVRPSIAPAPERPSAAPAPAPVYTYAMASPTGAGPALGIASGAPGGTGTGSAAATRSGPSSNGIGYRPASARDVGSMPEVDAEACGRAAIYPREAEQSGIEGDVRLRVALTERGQVHAVQVLSGLGKGLDAAAVDAIKNRCKFKPAVGRDGTPVAFVIQSYRFHFELPR